MARNEHEVVINRPVDQVFRFLADLDNWRQWGAGFQHVEKTTPGPVDVGTVWKVISDVQGQSLEMTMEVTEYQIDRRFGFRTTFGPVVARDTFTFHPVSGGTRLEFVLELDGVDPAAALAARQ
jgi:uncharacterized membrane protein